MYEGDWINGRRSGNGILSSLSGIYEGGFFDDLKEGFGIQRNTDRSEYRGDWYQGQMHGAGQLILPNGDVKEGNWEYGQYIGSN